MTKEEKLLLDALIQIAKENGPVMSFIAKVNSVNESDYTADVTFTTGTNIPDARLRSVVNGDKPMVMIPVVGSYVMVTRIELTNEWAVIAVSSIDKVFWNANQITINDGANDGLVKVKELTTKINAMEKDLNTLKTVFSAWVPVPNDGGAALKAGSATWSGQPLQVTAQNEIENTKVKH